MLNGKDTEKLSTKIMVINFARSISTGDNVWTNAFDICE